jgi:hypothetical protein
MFFTASRRRLKGTTGTSDEVLDDPSGKDALALAGLGDVVAEPLAQLRRQRRCGQALETHLRLPWRACDEALTACDEGILGELALPLGNFGIASRREAELEHPGLEFIHLPAASSAAAIAKPAYSCNRSRSAAATSGPTSTV